MSSLEGKTDAALLLLREAIVNLKTICVSSCVISAREHEWVPDFALDVYGSCPGRQGVVNF